MGGARGTCDIEDSYVEDYWCGSFQGERPLGRPVYRWDVNLNTDLEEVGFQGVDWVNLAQYRDSWQAGVLEH